jgi:hypothetical protein
MEAQARRISTRFLALSPLLALGAFWEWRGGQQLSAMVSAVIALLVFGTGVWFRFRKIKPMETEARPPRT